MLTRGDVAHLTLMVLLRGEAGILGIRTEPSIGVKGAPFQTRPLSDTLRDRGVPN